MKNKFLRYIDTLLVFFTVFETVVVCAISEYKRQNGYDVKWALLLNVAFQVIVLLYLIFKTVLNKLHLNRLQLPDLRKVVWITQGIFVTVYIILTSYYNYPQNELLQSLVMLITSAIMTQLYVVNKRKQSHSGDGSMIDTDKH